MDTASSSATAMGEGRPRTPTIAIAGGGPAGAVAALVLARRGLRPVVLEPDPGPRRKAGETLPPNLLPLLMRLGLDDELRRDGHLPSHGNRSAWGSDRLGENLFIASPYGHGWHVDRARFEARLEQAARDSGALWRRQRVEGVERDGAGWRLELSGAGEDRDEGCGETLHADFLIDATGRACRLARKLGARRQRHDRLVGAHAILHSERPSPDAFTLVEAVADGWWYSANLASGALAVCFFSDADLLERELLRGESEPWLARLAASRATRVRVAASDYRPHRAPRVLPAESSCLDRVLGERWLAVGDAAAAYDPLSSYGVTSAMGSAYYGACAAADLLAGRREAADAYRQLIAETYGQYRALLAGHYAGERRWPDAPFWRRRRELARLAA
jgi:flavin-dependent dehydrogenase